MRAMQRGIRPMVHGGRKQTHSRTGRHARRHAARALLGAMALVGAGALVGVLHTISTAQGATLPTSLRPASIAGVDTAGLRRVTLVNGRADSLQVEVRASGVDSAGVASDGGDCTQAALVGAMTLAPGQRWSVVSAGAICYRTAPYRTSPVGASPTWSAWTRRVLAVGERVRETL